MSLKVVGTYGPARVFDGGRFRVRVQPVGFDVSEPGEARRAWWATVVDQSKVSTAMAVPSDGRVVWETGELYGPVLTGRAAALIGEGHPGSVLPPPEEAYRAMVASAVAFATETEDDRGRVLSEDDGMVLSVEFGGEEFERASAFG